jgi:hypothetical protein
MRQRKRFIEMTSVAVTRTDLDEDDVAPRQGPIPLIAAELLNLQRTCSSQYRASSGDSRKPFRIPPREPDRHGALGQY